VGVSVLYLILAVVNQAVINLTWWSLRILGLRPLRPQMSINHWTMHTARDRFRVFAEPMDDL
jgi:hypothetical protein